MKRKTYPLRINPEVLVAMQRWANDDLRSLNAQIEYVLREGLLRADRYPPHKPEGESLEEDRPEPVGGDEA